MVAQIFNVFKFIFVKSSRKYVDFDNPDPETSDLLSSEYLIFYKILDVDTFYESSIAYSQHQVYLQDNYLQIN